jgi:2-polyprenyl-3-methyl-5-hydroxy-6-metoxy-1,4-benzoquinol methylase
MAIRIDPERNEVDALRRVGDWRGRRVLEIGCGDGRLTHRLAGLGARVQAIDPDAALIRKARRKLPSSFAPRVRFRVGTADSLEFPAETFDLVVYSWVF